MIVVHIEVKLGGNVRFPNLSGPAKHTRTHAHTHAHTDTHTQSGFGVSGLRTTHTGSSRGGAQDQSVPNRLGCQRRPTVLLAPGAHAVLHACV